MAATSTSSNNKTQCVKQIGGAATTAGVDYENYTCLLVLLRLLEDENVKRFYIAQNVEGCGAFDDLVIKVKYKSSTTAKLILVQLKHSAKNVTLAALASVEGNGDFQLKKYFKSYKTICSKIGKFENDILNDCNLEDMTFVLFTNAKCAVGDKKQRRSSFCCRKLLETGNEDSDVFKIDSTKQFKKFCSEMKKNKNPITQEENGTNFLQKLVIFSEQSNVNNLENILKDKIKDYVAGDNVPVEFALQMALSFISENSSKWLSRHSGVLSGIKFLYQGITVQLSEAEHFWTTSITRKILVKHICSDMKNGIVSVGKEMERSEDYYVDRCLSNETKCKKRKKYETENEWRDTTKPDSLVLICGAPGMGKSSFFTRQAGLIKSQNPEKFVIRRNVVDYSEYLRNMNIDGNMRNEAIMFLEEISGVSPGTLEYKIFNYSLLHDIDKMVIFLDGVDEISPNYYNKLRVVIQTIKKNLHVQLFVSTRPVIRERMESDLRVTHWNLLAFFGEQPELFFKYYCKSDRPFEILSRIDFRGLLSIPIFCRMVGDISIYSSKQDAPDIFKNIFNKSQMYDKFVDVMFEAYHRDKLNMDVNKPGAQDLLKLHQKVILEQYETVALLEIFDNEEGQILPKNIENESKEFLTKIFEGEEKTGFIINIKNKRPVFLHRTLAEYFCGRWFGRNPNKYTQLLNNNKDFPVEVHYFMSHKLPNQHKLFITILNVREQEEIEAALAEFKSELNILDPLNRSVLHFAVISNNKWAIRYLLYNDFITDEMVKNLNALNGMMKKEILFYWFNNILLKYKECGTTVTNLIGLFMGEIYWENVFLLLRNSKHSPLHTAILKQNEEDIAELLNSENINSRNALGLTPLHLACYMEDISTVEVLVKRLPEYSNDNVFGVYPHQSKFNYDMNQPIVNILKEFYINFMEEDTIVLQVFCEDYVSQGLYLHNVVQKLDLDSVENFINAEICDLNQIDFQGRTALHVAVAIARSIETNAFKLLMMILRGINYVQDFNGLYPHDYDQDNEHPWLLGYAFASGWELLPEDDKNILNQKVEELINKQLNEFKSFSIGMSLRQGKYQ